MSVSLHKPVNGTICKVKIRLQRSGVVRPRENDSLIDIAGITAESRAPELNADL
jgi:hypothetical protein